MSIFVEVIFQGETDTLKNVIGNANPDITHIFDMASGQFTQISAVNNKDQGTN